MAITETITGAAMALDRCSDHFADEPIRSNMVAASLRPPDPCELIRAFEAERTVGTAMRWGDGYTLSRVAGAGIEAIAAALPVDRRFELFGPTGSTADVAGRWSQRCDGGLHPIEMMRVYRLGELRPPVGVRGRMRPADDTHIEVGARWAVAFSEEIGHEPSSLDAARAQIGRAIGQGRLFTWVVDDATVAHLVVAVERFGVVRIGGVYSTPAERTRGHAAALTAAVSEHLLARPDVDAVTLNTQAANAATNRLYRRLGFEAHHELLIIDLVPAHLAGDDAAN